MQSITTSLKLLTGKSANNGIAYTSCTV